MIEGMIEGMIEVTVVRKRREAPDVCSFELRRPDGLPLPAFDAGAHIDVHIRDGLVRQYSLCNPPDECHRYLIGVLRDPQSRGGSAAMFDAVGEGARLRIGTPRNLFPLVPAGRTLLFGGGIGITPILCMAERLSLQGAGFTLHYCARSRHRAAFLDRLAGSPFAGRVRLHFDDGAADQRLDCPAVLAGADRDSRLYVCGPAGFMEHVIGTAQRLGWDPERIHREYFAAGQAAKADGDGAFTLRLARRGLALTVPPERTALEVLLDAGIDVPASCEQGVCGTCLTPVLAGTPDHRDVFLTDAEHARNDRFTPCCSRSRTDELTVDL